MFQAIRKWNHDRLTRRRLRREGSAAASGGAGDATSPEGPSTVRGIMDARFPNCRPLRLFTVPSESPQRISLVTDSISPGSFYGGVGTALILTALLAQTRSARLRIITRTEPATASNVEHLLDLYGIELMHDVEFAFVPTQDPEAEADMLPGELFVTTSWWTTEATMASVAKDSILYILQEDERMFYPFGDDRLRCESVLRDGEIRFVVNTKLLFEHLVSEGFDNIARNGQHFEPAFPEFIFHPREKAPEEKKTLLFYARPNHLRNVFYFGIEVLDEAIVRRIIDPALWDIVFVGKDVPPLTLGECCTPQVHEGLTWQAYAALAGRTDIGFSLMYTPHPSYPPLDLAASGAVVVTNRYLNKNELADYSGNIICADLRKAAMLQALEEAVRRCADGSVPRDARRGPRLNTDWRTAFAPVLSAWKER